MIKIYLIYKLSMYTSIYLVYGEKVRDRTLKYNNPFKESSTILSLR